MTTPNLTPEQQTIISAARGQAGTPHSAQPNLLISACAGSGKTTTLKHFARRLPVEPSLALAFNKRNAEDLRKALPGHVLAKTFNALGHGIWARTGAAGAQLQLDARKAGRLVRETGGQFTKEQFFGLRTLLDAARSNFWLPDLSEPEPVWGAGPEAQDWARLAHEHELNPNTLPLDLMPQLLRACVAEAHEGTIDFADQIYLPLTYVEPREWPSFKNVLVDEAQDLSPGNHETLKRLTRHGRGDAEGPTARPSRGRLIAVGDRAQAIYGFRGADTRSMDTLREAFDMQELELSVSFRCAEAITRQAQKRLPSMRARPGAPEGRFERWGAERPDGWQLSDLPEVGAVLCRNNAPLVSLALRLILSGRGVNFLGWNISAQLETVLKETESRGARGETPAEEALAALDRWLARKVAEYEANDLPHLIARANDKAECVRSLFEAGRATTVREARQVLAELFEPSNARLAFATVHRSKGFEWDEVFWLDPWLVPSKYARRADEAGNPEPLQQELNLRYVAITRAATRCVLLDTAHLQPEPTQKPTQ